MTRPVSNQRIAETLRQIARMLLALAAEIGDGQ